MAAAEDSPRICAEDGDATTEVENHFVLPATLVTEDIPSAALDATIRECQEQMLLWAVRLRELTRRQAIEL